MEVAGSTMRVDRRNKVALVTGSSRGIGQAIAQAFEKAGAHVWYHGTHDDGRARYVRADFTNAADVQRLADEITANESRLDILVNNAGIEPVMPLAAME